MSCIINCTGVLHIVDIGIGFKDGYDLTDYDYNQLLFSADFKDSILTSSSSCTINEKSGEAAWQEFISSIDGVTLVSKDYTDAAIANAKLEHYNFGRLNSFTLARLEYSGVQDFKMITPYNGEIVKAQVFNSKSASWKVYICKNGESPSDACFHMTPVNTTNELQEFTDVTFNAGDTLEVYAGHNGANPKNVVVILYIKFNGDLI